MIRKIIFFLALFYGSSGWCQISVEKYLTRYSSEEKASNFISQYEVEVNDVRQFEDNKIDFQQLETSINGYLELFIQSTQQSLQSNIQLRPKKIIIDLEFYNVTQGSSSEAIMKAIAFVKLDGGGYSNLNSSFNISAEEFTSIRLKNIQKRKNREEVKTLMEDFSKRFAKKIVNRILGETENEQHLVFEVISIGTAVNSDNIIQTKEKAALLALVRASEIAFGMKVTNTSEILDFGDVTDIVLSEMGGIVLQHEIIEESIKFTDDGHCCLMVKSLITKK